MSKLAESQPIELFYAEARANDRRQWLVALGVAEHFTNPAHPQFDIIRNVWHRFLQLDILNPIVLHENSGNTQPLRSKSPLIDEEVMAVKLGGEPRLMATLADRCGVPVAYNADDPRRELTEALESAVGAYLPTELTQHYGEERAHSLRNNFFEPSSTMPDAEIGQFAREARGSVLGRKAMTLWAQGFSPFVLYHNDYMTTAQETFAALPHYQAAPITLLPPESRYASLPQLAPTAHVM